MKNPRTDTKVFIVLECLAEHGAMDVDEVIDAVGNLFSKSTRSVMLRMLNDAVAQNYLVRRNDKYQLTDDIECYVFDVMDAKKKRPKRDLVPPPYRNIWSNEMQGYTASLYQNKRGYERESK